VEVAGTVIKFSESIKLLGVKLDPIISVNSHVTEFVRHCYYHIHPLRRTRPLITLESTKIVALGMVAARLDYCNSFLYGTSLEVAGDRECTGQSRMASCENMQ